MPRKPAKGRQEQRGLLQCERHLLLTGQCTPKKGSWKDIPGESWVRPFVLVSPGGRDELKKLWERYREELLQEWKTQGKRGQPWVVKFLARGW